MFRVTDKNGQQVAQFEHRSELETYLRASFPPDQFKPDNHRDDNNFDVMDSAGGHVATVSGPKPPREPRDEQAGGLQP